MDRLTALLNGPLIIRRLVAILFVVIAIAIVVTGVMLTASSLYSKAKSIREQRASLGRLQSAVALKPMLEASEQNAIASGMHRPEFLRGASEAIIQANLQTQLTAIAQAQGVDVLSIGNTPILIRGGTRFAGLQANLSGTNEGIHGTIYAIETSKPYLIIREAKMRSTLRSQKTRDGGQPKIALQIQFYGALPPGEGLAESATGAGQ